MLRLKNLICGYTQAWTEVTKYDNSARDFFKMKYVLTERFSIILIQSIRVKTKTENARSYQSQN